MADLEAPEPIAPEPVAADPPTPDPPPDPVEAESDMTEEELSALERSIDKGQVSSVDPRAVKAARGATRIARVALKKQTDELSQLTAYVNQARPYIDFLAANPGFMTRTQQETTPTPVTTTQPSDQKAETLARTLDLYTADGQPDVKRAQTILHTIDEVAEAKSEARIKPLEDSTTRERSQFMYQRALVTKAPDGRTVDRQVLDAIWARTDPKMTATEEGAAGVVAMALGLAVMQGAHAPVPAPLAPPNPPLHTDPAGSRTQSRAPLSALDESIAKIRGLDHKTYAERSKGFTPGRPSVLEDN